MIPGSANALLLASAAAAEEGISRSVRFNSSDSAYLSRTPASAGNRQAWAWSAWVKRSTLGGSNRQALFGAKSGAGGETGWFAFGFDTSDQLYWTTSGSTAATSSVYRDCSAWYHIVANYNGTNIKFFVNGSQVYSVARTGDLGINGDFLHTLGNGPELSFNEYFNGYLTDIHFIDGQALDPSSFGEFDDNGIWQPIEYSGSYGTNGFHLPFSDNSTAAALGTDTSGNGNDWTVNNISVLNGNGNYVSGVTGAQTTGEVAANLFDGNTGTYCSAATNGGTVTVTFSPSLSVTTSTRVFNGSSTLNVAVNGGSAVNYTGTGWKDLGFTGSLSSISFTHGAGAIGSLTAVEIDGVVLLDNSVVGRNNDSLVDVPTNGSQTDTGVGGEVRGNYATLNPLAESGGNRIDAVNGNLDADGLSYGNWGNLLSTIAVSSGKWYAEFTVATAGLGVAVGILDVNPLPSAYSNDDQYMGRFAKGYGYRSDSGNKANNNSATSYGATFTNGDVIGVALDLDAGTLVFYKNNTSQGTAFSSLSGTFAFAVATVDSVSLVNCNFGQRPFAYTAPSGFKALCTANLPAPVVTKPSEYMDVKLYTGNGSTQTISGLGFSPDLAWIKSRSGAYVHYLVDTVRGAQKRLSSNNTNAEAINAQSLTAFNSDGFDLGNEQAVNENNSTYVAWTWDAGETTDPANEDGSITSSVRANPSAGFSVVTYTGTGTAATVGHGLGVAPQLIIAKNRDISSNWSVYHTSLGKDYFLRLNTTDAQVNSANYWGTGGMTSTVFGIDGGTFLNTNTEKVVAYCFAPVAGYSAFGSFDGSSSTQFIYTGFLPRYLVIKCYAGSSSQEWIIKDTARNPYNAANYYLTAESSNNEGSSARDCDFLSNGFSVPGNIGPMNYPGRSYVYFAFAESPFNFSRAR